MEKNNEEIIEKQKTQKNNQNETASLQTFENNSVTKKANRKRSKDKGLFARVFSIIFSKTALQLFFSHHPFCEIFDNHVFKIGKLRLCRGCTLSYPVAYGLPIMYLLWGSYRDFLHFAPLWISNLWWFTIYSTILAFGTRYFGKKNLFINDLSKLTRGALAGFLFTVMISEIWYLKIIAAVGLFAGMAYLSLKRGKEMQHTCDQCEYGADYNNCPGWRDLAEIFPMVSSSTSVEKQTDHQEKNDTQLDNQ